MRLGKAILLAAILLAAALVALAGCEAKKESLSAAPAPSTTTTTSAAATEEGGFGVPAFKSSSRALQLDYFNSLPMEERFLFLGDFLPDTSFKLSATEVISFKPDGRFEILRRSGEAEPELFSGYWTASPEGIVFERGLEGGPWPPAESFRARRVSATLEGALDEGLKFVFGSLAASDSKPGSGEPPAPDSWTQGSAPAAKDVGAKGSGPAKDSSSGQAPVAAAAGKAPAQGELSTTTSGSPAAAAEKDETLSFDYVEFLIN